MILQRHVLSTVRHLCSRGFATATFKEQATLKWFRTVVLGEKLCPFARPFQENGMLRIISSKANTLQEAMDEIHREVEELVGENRQRTHESTLIVFDDRQEMALHFVHFTDLLKEARGNYRDLVDLIPFHPRNKHANLKGKDVPNEEPFDYSFRSPFPTIHLLREEDIMKSERAGDTDYIRRRNRDRFHRQGLDVCRERLQACYDVEK